MRLFVIATESALRDSQLRGGAAPDSPHTRTGTVDVIDFERLVRAQRTLLLAAQASLPPEWSTFKIVVKAQEESFQVSIEGPSTVTADEALNPPVRDVLDLHSEAGHPLRGFTYEFTRNDEGVWQGSGDFAYGG